MTPGHRYELHKLARRITVNGIRCGWVIYDHFDLSYAAGMSFWYYATRREALSHMN